VLVVATDAQKAKYCRKLAGVAFSGVHDVDWKKAFSGGS